MATTGKPKRILKRSKVKLYKTDPRKANLAVLARNQKKLLEFKKQHDVLKLVKAGNTFIDVGEKLGIDPKEALELTKAALDKWCTEFSLDAKQNRELDIQRIEAMLCLLWADIQPKPLVDKKGRPVYDRETGDQIMGDANLEAMKVYKLMMERKHKLLGLDPAESAIQVNNQINIIERRYIGVSPDDL